MSAKPSFALLNLLLVITLLLPLGGQPMAAQGLQQPPDNLPAATGQSGQQVSLSGWFTIIWGDPNPGSGGEPIEIYMLMDDTGQSTQLLLNEDLARPLGGILALNRQRVVVVGEWRSTSAQIAGARVLRVTSIQLGSGAKAPTAATDVSVIGPQPFVTILCKFSDVAAESKPRSYFQELLGSTYPELDHYWRELSYNTINIVGSGAVGWYTLPHPKSYYVYGTPLQFDFDRATNDCTAVADADVYFPSYFGINLAFNDDLGGYWGGGWCLDRDGVSKCYGMTWMHPGVYEHQGAWAHEMGHAFGLPHSSGAYGETYDNYWDVMSNQWLVCPPNHPVYGCVGQHTISYHKDMLGWVPAGQKYVATAFSQTVTLEQLALPQTTNYKMAQIPIGGSATYFYTVEVRRKVGYDAQLPGEAVIIHEVDTTRGRPAYVVDADWNGDTGDDGAMWTVGETFSDAVNSISVSVDSATATGFVVTIIFKPTPTQLSPAMDSAMPVGVVTFTWSSVPDATGYQIQIDTVPTFDSTGLIDQTVAGTSYSHDFTVLGSYYWRVRALPDGIYSSHWHFSIAEPLVQATTDTGDDCRPGIVQAVDGTLWVVWYSRRSGNYDIWYKTSVDGGTTWSAATQLTTHSSSNYSPAIAQAADGTLWVVWYSYRSGNADIWYRTSDDNGVTWSADTQLTTDSGSDYDPTITQAYDGTIWVVWDSWRNGNVADLYYKTSTDGGATWSPDIRLTTDESWDQDPSITRTADGAVWVAWHSWRTWPGDIYYKMTTDGGATWSSDTRLTTDTDADWAAAITQATDGRLWIGYQSYRSGNWDIWYQTSVDGGTAWSTAQQFTRFTGIDYTPALTSLPDDRVGLVWYSDRAVNHDIWFGIIGVHGDVNPPPHLDEIEHDPRPNPDSNDSVTVRADVSDETGVASVILKWWANGTPQADLTMYDDGAHDDYGTDDGWYGVQIGPFPVGTIVEYQAEIADLDGNTILAPQYPRWFESLEPFVKTADILFVPDYGGYDTGWFRSYYEEALGMQGYQYDVWDTGKRDEIDPATLNQYISGAVVWAVPEWGYVTDGWSSSQVNLQSYLDNGGKLFISGQDIGYYSGESTFFSDYLHATFVQDDTDLYGLNGVSGDPISDGLYLAISGGDGANNQFYPSEIDPIAPAVSIFTYDPSATMALGEPTLMEEARAKPERGFEEPYLKRVRKSEKPTEGAKLQGIVSSGTGAIRVDTETYKAVYFAFGFEAINSAADRQLVMERVLDWTWSLPGDLDFNCVVNVADVQRVASRWRMTDTDPDWNPRYDLNGDGIITVVDIMKVVAHWGETCP